MRISLPVRRSRSRPRRALSRAAHLVDVRRRRPGSRSAPSRIRAAVALPAVGVAAGGIAVVRRRLGHRATAVDGAVRPPAPASVAPSAVVDDPSPENPETDLPAAPS